MLVLAGAAPSLATARGNLEAALRSGAGLEKFKEMVELQGGDPRIIADPRRFKPARERRIIKAPRTGYVVRADADCIGRAVLLLGGGRTQVTDRIDPAAGISELVKTGEPVSRNQTVACLHAASIARLDAAEKLVRASIEIGKKPVVTPPLYAG